MSVKNKEIINMASLTSAILLVGFIFYQSKVCPHQSGRGFPIHFYTGEHLVPGNGDEPDEAASFSISIFIIDLIICLAISIFTIKTIGLIKKRGYSNP
ncbi:MAG: hypothetical protein MRY83_11700 [Flavobacteriales bacterium]|nr:hypothetical protein [Flavobacteriales bacterium]